jgi:hypothetical protein
MATKEVIVTMMHSRTRALAFGAALFAMVSWGCSKDGGNPAGPDPTPQAQTYALSGRVTGSGGTGINGATVTVTDGPNAGRSATADGNGNYTITGLQPAGFTARATARFYNERSKPVTMTSNQTLDFSLPAIPLWSVAGTGDTVFDMPRTVERVKITGTYTKSSSSNFVVWIDHDLIVNELVGSHWGQVTFSGTYAVSGGQVEIESSSGVKWTFTEVR